MEVGHVPLRRCPAGRNIHELLGTESTLLTVAMHAIATEGQWRGELIHTTRDGRRITVDSRWSQESGDASRPSGLLEINRDVTEQSEVNLRLERSLADLKEMQQQVIQAEKLAALGTMAAGIAHELNNPLMGIMNYVGYVRDVVADPGVKPVLDKVAVQLNRMRDLIKNLLTFSRPVEEIIGELSVAEAVDNILDLTRSEWKALDIQLEKAIPPDLPLIEGKSISLQQVLLNLLMNARDAVQEVPRKFIRISAERVGQSIRIQVADNGHGVPTDIESRIFDPFFTTKAPGKGSGLGLAVSRSLVADMGGTISFTRGDGDGSIFTVALPIGAHCQKIS